MGNIGDVVALSIPLLLNCQPNPLSCYLDPKLFERLAITEEAPLIHRYVSGNPLHLQVLQSSLGELPVDGPFTAYRGDEPYIHMLHSRLFEGLTALLV